MTKTPSEEMQELRSLLELQVPMAPEQSGGIPEGTQFFGAIEVCLGTQAGQDYDSDMSMDDRYDHADDTLASDPTGLEGMIPKLAAKLNMPGHEILEDLIHMLIEVASSNGYELTDADIHGGTIVLALHGEQNMEGERVAMELLRCGKALRSQGDRYLSNQRSMNAPDGDMLRLRVNGWLNISNDRSDMMGPLAGHRDVIRLAQGQTTLQELVQTAINSGKLT